MLTFAFSIVRHWKKYSHCHIMLFSPRGKGLSGRRSSIHVMRLIVKVDKKLNKSTDLVCFIANKNGIRHDLDN